MKKAVEVASFDFSGPGIHCYLKTKKLALGLDEDTLASELNLKTAHLMNDLEAVARAVPALRSEDMITIAKGEPVANGPIAVIAPGTGLGESFLTWDGAEYVAYGSEGG